MEKIILRKGKKINYRIKGEGKVVVLLHGYLESLDVWSEFYLELAKQFRVLAINLPGFGESDTLNLYASMEAMSDCVNAVLESEDIEKCIMTGHSMGGYVSLAFAEKHKDKLIGLSLFHSTPFADNEEKKQNRQREIELITQGKKSKIISINIPRTFADDNVSSFSKEINNLKDSALQTSDEGIIHALYGMIQRPDRQHVLKNINIPVLLIAGKNDNYIPLEISTQIAELSTKIQLEILENSGHMGFVEEKEKSVKILSGFISKL